MNVSDAALRRILMCPKCRARSASRTEASRRAERERPYRQPTAVRRLRVVWLGEVPQRNTGRF